MKDIKTLYNLAKSSKGSKEISAYQEAINELLESNPADYISNIEYIISSNIGLQTLNEFVDKYGLSVACYDSLMESINECIRKCEIYKRDVSLYNETVSYLESFHSKYENCFNMFEYFRDKLPDNYISTYYGFNNSGIQNKKLISGMVSRFGEAAIPDILITSQSLGDNAINTALQFLESNQIFDSPSIYQWIIESCNDIITSENIYLEKIKSKSLQSIVGNMRQRNNAIHREAVIMNNSDMFLEYTTDELDAVRELIYIREYQLLCTESFDKMMSIQDEIYSLYEEFAGIDRNFNSFARSSNKNYDQDYSGKYDLKDIRRKIVRLVYDVDDMIKIDFNRRIKEHNKTLPFFHEKVDKPSATIYIGDNYGPIKKPYQVRDISKFINMSKLSDESEYIDGMKIWVQLHIYTYSILSADINKRSTKLFYDILTDLIKPDIESRMLNIDPDDKMDLGQMLCKIHTDEYKNNALTLYIYEWTIPLCVYKSYVLGDNSVNESLDMVNTRNKKTGDIPDYLARNHNLTYGEEDKPDENKNDSDREKSLDDYRRPSAPYGNDNDINHDHDTINSIDDIDKGSNNTSDDKDKSAITNYYYYTYNNSLNKNSHSFNRDNSDHSIHDRSTHTNTRRINDDHSTGKKVIDDNSTNKRMNSDNNRIKVNDSEHEESFTMFKLNLFDDKELFTENTVSYNEASLNDNRPESDHPIRDTFMDIDRGLGKKQQETKKKVQDIHNAGKAFIKPAVRTQQWLVNMVAKWKDNDETKLKEKLADPLARKNLFSAIKTSITIGSFAKAGLLFNPIFLFLAITRKVGKDKKEYRIRNEMIGELKAEIEVIDEKIKDADNKGDRKEKYQLMRLKNEINKKLVRVGGGKGWKGVV